MSIKFHNIFPHKNFYKPNENSEISENAQKVNFNISKILYKLEGDIEKEDINSEDYGDYDLVSFFNFIKNGDLKKLNADSDFFVEAMTILFENYDEIKFSGNISEEEFVNVYINNGLENIILINLPFDFQEKEKILEKILKRNSYETIRIILDNGEDEILELLKNFLAKKDNNFIEGILELFIGTKNLYLILKKLSIFGDEKDILEFFLERDFENTKKIIYEKNIIMDNYFNDDILTYYLKIVEKKDIENVKKVLYGIRLVEYKAQEVFNKILNELEKYPENNYLLFRKFKSELFDLLNIINNLDVSFFDTKNPRQVNFLFGKIIKKLDKIYLKNKESINNINKIILKNEIIIISLLFETLKEFGASFEDLEKIGFSLEKTKISEKLENEIDEKVGIFMSLYRQNYDNKNFLAEIEQGLNKSFKKEGTETYLLVNNSEILFSSYLEQKTDGIYWGGLNTSLDFAYYGFGTWFIDKIIKEKGEENDIFCTVTTKIDGKENKRYKALLKLYKSKGFEEDGEGENSSSKFIKLKREKTGNY